MSPAWSLRLFCAFLLSLALPPAARAEWVVEGIPICMAAGVQARPGIVSNGSGGAIVFWVDGRDLRSDLYAQQVTADGMIAAGWPSNGVKFGTAYEDSFYPDWMGVPDGLGGVIIVWEDLRSLSTSQHNIFTQRITAEGTIAPGWPADGFPVCTAPGDQRAPRLVSDGAGGAIVAWYDCRNDPNQNLRFPKPDIYAQRITADGNIAPGWLVDGIPICTAPEAQALPCLASDDAGGAIIAWVDTRTLAATGGDIYAQRITSSGQVASGWILDGIPICTAVGNQTRPTAVPAGEGSAVIIWQDIRSNPGSLEGDDVYAQKILADATVAPGWPENGVPLCRAPETQEFLSAAPDGLGGAIVAWEDYRSYSFPVTTTADIYAQRVAAEGVIPPGWPADGIAVSAAPSFQLNPQLAADGAAGAYIVWEDTRSGDKDVYAQHVTASGQVAPGWVPNGIPICTKLWDQAGPVIALDGLGGAITAWSDFRKGNGDGDIFAQKLGMDGPVATLVTLSSAQAEPGWVLLRWYAASAAGLTASVHRRAETSDWVRLGPAVPIGEHELGYEDRQVSAGRYAYRLGIDGPSGEQFTEEVWVDVPAAFVFRLEGFRPNPAVGGLRVSFSLASEAPGRIEVIDVAGRRVLDREVGSLGAGNHLVDLGGAAALQAGVYWIRLTQSGRSLSVKGIVAQ